MIHDYINKAKGLTETYNREMDALKDEMSMELGVTVISIDEKGRVHIDEPEFVAALPGAEFSARTSDFFQWEVHAEQDGAYFFAIMTDAVKRELADGRL